MNNILHGWAPVIFLWIISVLFTAILIAGSRTESRREETAESTGPALPAYEIILTGEAEETEEMSLSKPSEAPAEKENRSRETTGEPETRAVLFEPVTHALLLGSSAPAPDRESDATPVSPVPETGTAGRDAEPEEPSVAREETSPVPVSEASSGMKSESLTCRYRTTLFSGGFRTESIEDRILMNFSRTASGEAIRFEVVTYDESWISALSAGSPAESAEHAALLKERTGTAGSVYAYAVRELSGNMIYIDLFPDDRVVAVEESGRNRVRFFTDTGYNGAVLDSFFPN